MHSESQGTVVVSYDLSDAEGEQAEIIFNVLTGSGNIYQVSSAALSGDVGYPISPGSSKQITWDYPDSLASEIETYEVKIVADAIQQIVDRVDSQRLKSTIQFIAQVRHPNDGLAHLNAVKDTIERLFFDYGLDTSRQAFTYSSYQAHNIFGFLEGQVAQDTTYIIDAHFDGVQGSPGADDNASAVVGMLEAARILSDYQFARSIRFIGFDQEEAGLIGSQAYVQQGISGNEHIAGVFNFEMIGYYSEQNNSQNFPPGFDILFPDAHSQVQAENSRGNFITNVANTASEPLKEAFDAAAANYVPDLRVISLAVSGTGHVAPDLRRSDHASFWDAGYQALMLTDGSNFRNPNYHTANDTIGSLNYTFMANVVKATIAAVCMEGGIQQSSEKTTSIESGTGIKENLKQSILVYPNPVSDQINIHLSGSFSNDLNLKLYDNNGALIIEEEHANPVNGRLSLNLNDLSTGLYYLQVRDGKKSVVKKVVVE
ncbi:MAG: M20/M25/M40 family metallo-hydrolase [Chitinophagales bacterium]